MATAEKLPTYRFSDVVRGIGSTPKSFRRWLLTLGIESKGRGWHEFTPVQILEFAVMRHLVDWGVSIVDAADLSVSIMGHLLTDADPTALEDAEFRQRALASDLFRLDTKELVVRMIGRQAFIGRIDGVAYAAYPDADGPPSYVGAQGSHLTLHFGEIALGVHQALHGDEVESAE